MGRKRSVLASRTGRATLQPSDAPVWEAISPGVRLGYRRGRSTNGRGGTWLAAGRSPDGIRVQTKLGKADDIASAGEAGVLSSEQAKEAARAWVRSLQRGAPVAASMSVDDVLDRYLASKAAEGMRSLYDATSRAKLHIRPKLGRIQVPELTVDRLRRWRDDMALQPRRFRTGQHSRQTNIRLLDRSDPEASRRRRDTANRTLTTLKAALNWAYQHRLVRDDAAWRFVKPFRNTTAARVRFLDTDEQQRLLNHATGPIRDLIAAALMTGCRFGELARLTVQDFDPIGGLVFVAESKSGRPRHIPLTPGGLALFIRLSDKADSTRHLLRQASGEAWKPATYHRAFKAAIRSAGIKPMTLHELRHSYASTMIRAGAPLMVVADALGHADTRMTTKHYAHLAPSFVAETIRRTAPDLI